MRSRFAVGFDKADGDRIVQQGIHPAFLFSAGELCADADANQRAAVFMPDRSHTDIIVSDALSGNDSRARGAGDIGFHLGWLDFQVGTLHGGQQKPDSGDPFTADFAAGAAHLGPVSDDPQFFRERLSRQSILVRPLRDFQLFDLSGRTFGAACGQEKTPS